MYVGMYVCMHVCIIYNVCMYVPIPALRVDLIAKGFHSNNGKEVIHCDYQ